MLVFLLIYLMIGVIITLLEWAGSWNEITFAFAEAAFFSNILSHALPYTVLPAFFHQVIDVFFQTTQPLVDKMLRNHHIYKQLSLDEVIFMKRGSLNSKDLPENALTESQDSCFDETDSSLYRF